MILRDKITQIIKEKESDGMGGSTQKADNEQRIDIECKASLNTSPEVATAYGPAGEQIIYVTTRQPLDKGALFLYKNKYYKVRFQSDTIRFFYSTLVEVKKGA